MEDIQFWLYLAFALIYFITRGLRKKPEQSPRPGQPEQDQSQGDGRKRPVSFEELLKEFTEGKSQEEEEPEPAEGRQKKLEKQWVETNKPEEEFEEGVTRRFSDEESKRVYEESVKMAEGAALEFKRDEHFKSSLVREEEEEEVNSLALEIREGLSSQDEARKAIIYSEILTRKY